ncbi:MAG TPA: ASKHA domain-containing protein [Vicinamibacteria bacterium]
MSAVRIRLEPRGLVLEVARGGELADPLAAAGVELPCGGRGECGGCRVRVLAGEMAVAEEDRALLGAERVAAGWRLACRCRADRDATLEVEEWRHPILGDETPFAFTPREGVGIAVDLGTTTLVAQLVDLERGAVLGVETALNAQARYGSDVMTRIEAALAGEPLEAVIRRQVGELVAALLDSGGIAPERLARIVLVGNTAMHHLFGGQDVAPLAAYPFETPRLDALHFRAGELGFSRAGSAEVVFLPCLGGFVGSDVLAGLRAISLDRAPLPAAMFDLGTNGEIVVGTGERLYCASAAAGPAFEGARISCGMRAAAGAITAVEMVRGRLVSHVLGGGPGRGICGSGLVDAVARGLETGRIEPSGRLAGGATALELSDGLALTQRDVRELQLAKGALAVGLRLLSARAGTEPAKLARLSLAGAFGNYVSRESARRIGLFDTPLGRVASAGNAALLGAKLALFDDDLERRALRERIVHVPLASVPGFADAFAEAMGFPE